MDTCEIAIVGGGCSGVLVAVQLLRHGFGGSLALVEMRSRLGRGLAYSTPFEEHLLNVTAAKMSALPAEPSHFLDWLRHREFPGAGPQCFAPRRIYGEYLEDLLRTSLAKASGVAFRHIRAEVTGIEEETGAPELLLQNGDRLRAAKVVLALGNPAASPGVGKESERWKDRWHVSPWIGDALRVRFPGERILLLGAGLTAVDAALVLASQKNSCHIYMLSRRGLRPQVHDLSRAPHPPPAFPEPATLRTVLRQLREQAEAAHGRDDCWRPIVDSLRPISNQLWQRFPEAEQRRFQRHLRTFWETHRHRMAPQICERLNACLERGVVEPLAGRIHQTLACAAAVELLIRLRGGGERLLPVDRIINCTGIHENYRDSPRRLVRSLMEQGVASTNHLGSGFRSTDAGALIGADGRASERLFTLGPPRRGELIETTAVPEIRAQAEILARHLMARGGA